MYLSQLFTPNDLWQWISDNWLELFGVATGLLYIWLEINQKSSMWVIGFISSSVYVLVFFRSKLYGDMALYIYYVMASVYGWYCWRYAQKTDGATTELSISRIRLLPSIVLAAIIILLYIVISYILDHHTDSPVPYHDALGTSLSIVATWMLARKILEHWVLWIFINFFMLGLCFYRGLYPTAGLFAIYGILSVTGWFKWKQSYDNVTE